MWQDKQKISRTLPVQLTKEELRERSERLAGVQIQKETAEIDLKEYVSGVRNVIKSMAAEVSKLSRYVHEGKEPRAVECYGQMNLRRSVIELVRNDTGEIVDSRPMTPEEYQLTLAGIEEDSPVAKNVRTIK